MVRSCWHDNRPYLNGLYAMGIFDEGFDSTFIARSNAHKFSNLIDPSSKNSATKRHSSNKLMPNSGLVPIANTGTNYWKENRG